jgi:hypothetical protein
MKRKGFSGTGEVRGLLAAKADAAGRGYGRSGYLSAVEKGIRAYRPR